jgi:hypothetical protein
MISGCPTNPSGLDLFFLVPSDLETAHPAIHSLNSKQTIRLHNKEALAVDKLEISSVFAEIKT